MPKTRRVALMLDLEWPYKRHVGVFTGAQKYAQDRGWHTFVDEYVDATLRASPLKRPAYDGVIARASRKLALSTKRLLVPVVNVWRSSPVWKSMPGVFPDYSAIGCLRAEHLLSRGVRRFAALTSENDLGQDLELQAFSGTIAEAGFSCASTKVPLFAFPIKNWRKFERALAGCIDDWVPPIGVYVGSDRDGRIVAQKCYDRGMRVPEDVSIIAGTNEETYCEGLRPTISSVEMDFERIGYEAAKLLDSLMNGEAPPATPLLIPPKGLVVRESTDFFFVNDAVIAAALKFIAEKCHKDIGQDDVARAVATELRTLQLRFEKYLGRSIAAEIRRVRIERAKRELAQSDRSLTEIASAVGFGSTMRMCETFHRELDISPSQYRKVRQTKK